MSLVLVAKASHQRSKERQHCSDNACWKPHLRLTNTIISFRVEICDLVREGAAEVRANE